LSKSLKMKLSKVAQLIVLETLQVLLLQENVDTFLDVGDLGYESRPDLVDGLADQERVLHLLASLHDTDNSRL
jgi:hypothetical protein